MTLSCSHKQASQILLEYQKMLERHIQVVIFFTQIYKYFYGFLLHECRNLKNKHWNLFQRSNRKKKRRKALLHLYGHASLRSDWSASEHLWWSTLKNLKGFWKFKRIKRFISVRIACCINFLCTFNDIIIIKLLFMKRFCSRIKDHRNEASVWWAWPDGCLIMVWVCLRWLYPRTAWSVRGRWQWAGQSRAVAVSSSSWAGWAYCPAYTGSSQAAGGLWSLGTGCVSSPSSPSWWRLRRATASARQRKHQPAPTSPPAPTGPARCGGCSSAVEPAASC